MPQRRHWVVNRTRRPLPTRAQWWLRCLWVWPPDLLWPTVCVGCHIQNTTACDSPVLCFSSPPLLQGRLCWDDGDERNCFDHWVTEGQMPRRTVHTGQEINSYFCINQWAQGLLLLPRAYHWFSKCRLMRNANFIGLHPRPTTSETGEILGPRTEYFNKPSPRGIQMHNQVLRTSSSITIKGPSPPWCEHCLCGH